MSRSSQISYILTVIAAIVLARADAGPLTDRLLHDGVVPAPSIVGDDENVEKEPFDLTKPVVSRGFGASVDDEADPLLVEGYNSGLVAFFFKDYKLAAKRWRGIAEKGYAKAQASLAWLYQAGAGVERSDEQAVVWYRKAAEQGHAVAQNNLGVMYENGWAVKRDHGQAVIWYRRSAEQGYGFAQFNLASMLLNGEGVAHDREEALKWLQSAAGQGVKQAVSLLAELRAQR